MNDRIQELSVQCWYTDADTGEEEFDREKFAELIVKQCIDAAFRNGDNIDYIKEHFGVE